MLSTILRKSVAPTAMLAVALVALPAQGAPAPAGQPTCGQLVGAGYQDGVTTRTDVRLRASMGQYGSANSATVTVGSEIATPTGSVRVTIAGQSSTAKLVNGSATVALPASLGASKTYTVQSTYNSNCRAFKGSGASAAYTVFKADTGVKAGVVDARRATFSATFNGGGGLNPSEGTATFKVLSKSKVVRQSTAAVRSGGASVNLADLATGAYTLEVSYSGSANFNSGSTRVGFSVAVGKAVTTVQAGVVDAKRATFSATVSGSGGTNPSEGTATFKVLSKSKVVRQGTAAVRSGRASVNLADLTKGTYTLEVSYSGSANFNAGSTRVGFTSSSTRVGFSVR